MVERVIDKIRSKFPSRQEILPVFSTIVFLVFSWALYHMFWQAPSWLYYMNVWDVLALSAYVLAFSLFESACLLGLVIVLCLVFPARLFKEQFIAQGSAAVGLFSAAAVLIQRNIERVFDLRLGQLIVYPLAILAGLLALLLVSASVFRRWGRLARLVNALADRMIVFAMLYVPLGLLGLVVVVIRNIF